jgi:RHH-type proline utilization regulon transcriptional repressor/proline dehydrogenase/delta 1-pyrroline-5-carboxylate dehydrogenase
MAAAPHAIRPFIAETGGLNAMIVDSSALSEQVVTDAVESAFRSAGQRCSALRVLFLQDEVAPKILEMLAGAMDELEIGDPAQLATDVGPVIDERAREGLLAHIEEMRRVGRIVHQCRLDERHEHGSFVPPTLVEIDRIGRLTKEPFGPVLHVVRYRASCSTGSSTRSTRPATASPSASTRASTTRSSASPAASAPATST